MQTASEDGRAEHPVALVLPGGGARGAYEIGAAAELLPALEARGERVSIFCGTSVGAINAALLASLADQPAADQVERALSHWISMRKSDVIRRIVGLGTPLTLIRWFGELLGLPGPRVSGMLDPSPLGSSLDQWVDWTALRSNVQRGRVRAVCVVATSLARGGPVAFVDAHGPAPAAHPEDGLNFVRVRLAGEHVRASAAIPFLFGPVEVTAPRSARGFYVDGGTRLNTPIKPAIALGAERVVVISFEPLAGTVPARARASTSPGSPGGPGLADVAANVLDGLLVDQVSDDVQRMLAINSFFAEHAGSGPSASARAYRRARGRPPYRRLPYAVISPRRHGEIARLAERVFAERFGGLKGLRAPDYPLLARLLGGGLSARGELISFLLFDEAFTRALIDAGRRDARRWLRRHPGFWCADPAHDFAVAPQDAASMREEQALEEWRALSRA